MPPQLPIPSPSTIKRHARQIRDALFKNKQYYYRTEQVRILLNQVSGYEEANNCNTEGLLWGDCIVSVSSIRFIMKKLGVKGTDAEQQIKQAIAAAMLVLEEDKILNKKLLVEVLPHEDEHERNKWIDKCVDRRKKFEIQNDFEYFCDNGQTYDGPSCV